MKIRKQKNKEVEQQNFHYSSYRSLRKKQQKNPQTEELLKSNIVKKFCIIEKKEIDAKELRWVMLGLGYSKKEIKTMILDYNQLKHIDEEDYQYRIDEVYAICQKNPPKDKWRRQCFDLFSSDKKRVTLHDMEKSWRVMKAMSGNVMSHEDLIQLMADYAIQDPAHLTMQQFDKLLLDVNSLSK